MTLSRTTTDAQPQQFKIVVITDELMKMSLNWIHERLYYIIRFYVRNLGMIDKDAFIPVRFLASKLQTCWNDSSSDYSIILYPTKDLLSLFLLTDNSGDFEQWAGIRCLLLFEQRSSFDLQCDPARSNFNDHESCWSSLF